MKTIDISDEDFEYLRFLVRVQGNSIADRVKSLAEFAEAAHDTFNLGEAVRGADVQILRAYETGLDTYSRIEEALENAEDLTDEPPVG